MITMTTAAGGRIIEVNHAGVWDRRVFLHVHNTNTSVAIRSALTVQECVKLAEMLLDRAEEAEKQ